MGSVGTSVGNDLSQALPKMSQNGNWIIRTQPDGFKECWYRGPLTFTLGSGAGLPEMRIMTAEVALPIQYVNVPCAAASCDWGVSEWVQTTPEREKVGIRKFAVGGNSQNVKTQNVCIHVAGY